MTDRATTQQKKATINKNNEATKLSEIKADLLAAIEASQAAKLSKTRRAALNDDVVFHFNELLAIEMHTKNAAVRRACSALIDGHQFDRTKLPNLAGVRL